MSVENTQIRLPTLQMIVLSKEDDDEVRIEANWGCIERLERNALRVSLAAGLSTVGAMLAGFLPTIGGILAGGVLSGIGNGASTWLAWEKSDQYFLEARLIEDFPKIFERAQEIDQFLDHFIAEIPVTSIETVNEPCHLERHGRNFVRLCTAGSLSLAGGLLGGFVPTTAGIIGGAVLGGIGNGVSTWLAYEQTNDALIHRVAFVDLPKEYKKLNDCTSDLLDLIAKIKMLNPNCRMTETLIPDEPEGHSSCSRYARNFTYVNIAGWMSAAGGWMGGYWPHPAGITIGAGLASAANAISTWLAWEKPNDQEMEKTAVKFFPKLVLKVDAINQKLSLLKSVIKNT